MILKYIPNALTLFRLGLIIPFLICLYHQQYVLAFYIFIIAGLTDGLDGWLARYFNWQSTFGTVVDPLSDKILVGSSFISLALIGSLPWWLVALVFLRDFSISVGVVCYWFIQRKLDFEPTFLSKVNTTFQLTLVVVCLFELAFFKLHPDFVHFLIYLTAFTTSITYVHYAWIGCHKAWPQKDLKK